MYPNLKTTPPSLSTHSFYILSIIIIFFYLRPWSNKKMTIIFSFFFCHIETKPNSPIPAVIFLWWIQCFDPCCHQDSEQKKHHSANSHHPAPLFQRWLIFNSECLWTKLPFADRCHHQHFLSCLQERGFGARKIGLAGFPEGCLVFSVHQASGYMRKAWNRSLEPIYHPNVKSSVPQLMMESYLYIWEITC